MNNRKALIIGSPDSKIPGVNIDIKRLKEYLMSPIGGLWYNEEITTLVSPSATAVKNQINLLRLADYSLVFFAGHGYHSIERRRTILEINKNENLDSLELRIGAPKHSLILDCCRKPVSERRFLKAHLESYAFDSVGVEKLNPSKCRIAFDNAISRCDNGLVVMNACAITEVADESDTDGGFYTSSLIDAGNEWAKYKLLTMNLVGRSETSSTQESHEAAAKQVKLLSGGRQNPSFEGPRSEKKFPFAVVA